jgi:hypothetical protein
MKMLKFVSERNGSLLLQEVFQMKKQQRYSQSYNHAATPTDGDTDVVQETF